MHTWREVRIVSKKREAFGKEWKLNRPGEPGKDEVERSEQWVTDWRGAGVKQGEQRTQSNGKKTEVVQGPGRAARRQEETKSCPLPMLYNGTALPTVAPLLEFSISQQRSLFCLLHISHCSQQHLSMPGSPELETRISLSNVSSVVHSDKSFHPHS